MLERICCLVLQCGSYAELSKCSKELNVIVEKSQSTKCCEVLLVFGKESADEDLLLTGSACPCVMRHDAGDSANTVAALALHSRDTCANMRQKRLLANKGTN